MDIFQKDINLETLPKLGRIDTHALWESIPVAPIYSDYPLLDLYERRHDHWVEKVRFVGLDSGLLVDYRLMPGLDRLVDRIYCQCGWARPEIYIVSDIGRKGIDSWSAVSVMSESQPVILLGSQLVESLNFVELAFVIGHETGHLLGYNSEWRRQVSLSFLIREYIESDQHDFLSELDPDCHWENLYKTVMENCRAMELQCDRLGLLLCGDGEVAARAILKVSMRNHALTEHINIGNYLGVHLPLMEHSPAMGPFTVNAGHPFVPYRLKHLMDFSQSGKLAHFIAANAQ